MLEASCHCGAVRIQVSEQPRWLTSCNCSLCRRLGALWLHCHPSKVSIVKGAGKAVAYVQGDRTLEMYHCPTCGCTTHWESVQKEDAERMGVNARLIDPAQIAGIKTRHFDGAESFDYLD